MNKSRKKQLLSLREQLGDVKDNVEMLKEEEQECYDNLPESLQCSEKGETMEEWIDKLDDLCYSLDDAVSNFEELELD